MSWFYLFLEKENRKLSKWAAVGLLILVTVSSSVAAANSAQAFIEFLETTKTLNQQIKIANGNLQNCDLDKEALECNSASLCKKLPTDSLYTYVDQKGYRNLNTPMIIGTYNYMNCGSGSVGVFDEDPFLYFEKLVHTESAGGSDKLAANQKRFAKEMNRVEAIFKDAKSNMVKALRIKENANNRAEIANLIRRVESISFYKYSLSELSDANLATSCEAPNAYYEPSFHRVIVCPQFLTATEGSIFKILAHEVAHSIDSCVLQFDLKNQGYQLPKEFGFSEYTGSTRSASISPKNNPLADNYQCLANSNISEIEPMTLPEVLEDYDAAMKIDPSQSERLTTEKAWIQKNFEQSKGCHFVTDGQEQEISSDWLASLAVAEKLKSLPDASTKKEFVFTAAISDPAMCPSVQQKAQQAAQNAKGSGQHPCRSLDAYLDYFAQNKHAKDNSHPTTVTRVNKILFAHPEVRKSLGCQGGPQSALCE